MLLRRWSASTTTSETFTGAYPLKLPHTHESRWLGCGSRLLNSLMRAEMVLERIIAGALTSNSVGLSEIVPLSESLEHNIGAV